MGLAFVIFFPFGAIIIRFLGGYLPVPARLHYILQLFTFGTVIISMGLGVYISQGQSFLYFRNPLPKTPLTGRSILRHYHRLPHLPPSRSGLVPPSPLRP